MWSDPRTYLVILALLTVVVQFVWLLSRLNSTSKHQRELIELLRDEIREQNKFVREELLLQRQELSNMSQTFRDELSEMNRNFRQEFSQLRQELSQVNQNILDIARDKT
jgi:biopolymer transport protein ExbB/TolQ